MQVPMYKGQGINTNVTYGSRASGRLMDTANATERLTARLQGVQTSAMRLAEPQITEETVQSALKDVEEGKIDSDNVAIVARDVYRKTANSALMADVEVSGKKLATQIENEQTASGKYDVNAFNTAWNSYATATLKSVDDIVIKQSLSDRLSKMGAQYSGAIGTLQTKQQREIQAKNFEAKMTMDIESLNAAFGVSDEETIRLQNEISTTLQTMVDAGFIAPGTAAMNMKKIAKGAYLSNLQRGLTTAINNGTAYKYYEQFKKADHQGILDNKDLETFRQSIQSQIATDVKVYNQQLQASETQFKIGELEAMDKFNDMLVSETLTTNDVDQALATGKIDLSTHEDYIKRINQPKVLVDKSDKKLMFQTHVLDFTEEEILTSPHLTDKSKWDLIRQRRTELKDETNWLSSQSGKEARDRIKRTFNIIEGTLMAQMDFNNKNMTEYDEMYKNFYSEVEALPFEQRATKSILIADRLISEYKIGKNADKEERKQRREEKKKADEEAKAKAYKDSTTGKFMNMLKNGWSSSTQFWEDLE